MSSLNATTPAMPNGGPPPSHVSLDSSLGAMFIAFIFVATLFGVTNVQSFIYFQNSTRDPRHMKCTIAFLWLLDAFHLALISHVLYFYMVTNFSDISIITKPTWSLCVYVLVTTIIDLIVRLYYVRRVWIMSKRNRLLTGGLLVLTSAACLSGMSFGIIIFSYTSLFQFEQISWLAFISLGSILVADIWIAATLCYFLGRNRTGFKGTDKIVNTLMLYIINTGLLTSICSILCFVSFATMPHNYIYIGFHFNLSKLYFNSLLATLNARKPLRVATTGSAGHAGTFEMPHFKHARSQSTSKNGTCLDGGSAISDASERMRLNSGDKGNRGVAVIMRTETGHHVDEVRTLPERYASILPL